MRRANLLLILTLCLPLLTPGWQAAHAAPAVQRNDDPAPETREEQETALIRAAKVDNVSEARRVLALGIDPNLIANERGETVLMLAVREEAPRVLALLLDSPGIEIERQAKNGDTAIMLAAFKGQVEFMRALLAKGAKLNRSGWTPLHYAAFGGHAEALQFLLKQQAELEAPAPNGSTAIMLAAYAGQIQAVKVLLDAGADPLRRNQQGMNAIDMARQIERQDIVDGLIWQMKKQGRM
ncbi:ankyrin repeat domain-containing protein [Massilia sp. W12]|uniref:ankyrin repeat domain-containing protein n=1 Tax=Massilia sp. W12 TaxID=3126507 RepID=UPI0030D4FD96